MLFNRVKKQIILALFVSLIPTSQIYPAWGWRSFTTSFSTAVSQLWNKASSAISEASPKMVAVGAVLTAGVAAGVYWFKKKNREIERLKLEKASCLAGEAQEALEKGRLQAAYNRLEVQHAALEQQLKEQAVDMVDTATQTDLSELGLEDQDRKYLDEQADEQWTPIEFLTPEVIKQQIAALKNDYKQLSQSACATYPIAQLAHKAKHELDQIKSDLEHKKTDLATRKANLHLIISARTDNVDELHDCLKKEYDANRRAIRQNAGIELSPEQYYNYLCINQAHGFNMSSTEMMNIINKKKEDAAESDKWILRQLGYVFGNDAAKEHFDAFLQGKEALQQLLFDEIVKGELLSEFDSVTDSQMDIEEYLGTLNARLRKLASASHPNGNGKSSEDVE